MPDRTRREQQLNSAAHGSVLETWCNLLAASGVGHKHNCHRGRGERCSQWRLNAESVERKAIWSAASSRRFRQATLSPQPTGAWSSSDCHALRRDNAGTLGCGQRFPKVVQELVGIARFLFGNQPLISGERADGATEIVPDRLHERQIEKDVRK